MIPSLSADEVCAHLGIPLSRLRSVRRHLQEPADIYRDPQDARSWLYTPAGLERLRSLFLGEALPPTSPAPEGNSSASQEAAAEPLTEFVTVTSTPRAIGGAMIHFPNPHVVRCRRTNGETIYVRVPTSAHFTANTRDGTPMTLRARLELDPPVWVLVGRCPRWPGRW